RHGRINEFNNDVGADAFDIALAPCLEGDGGGGAAAFLGRTLVAAAGGVGFFFVWRAVRNIDTAAIGLPAGNTAGELLVRIRDTAVVLFFEFVLDGVWGGVAAQPELLDELLSFF